MNGAEKRRLFIGGRWTEPDHGHYEVIDPATEEVVGLAPEASREQVYAAAAAARRPSPPGPAPAPRSGPGSSTGPPD